MLGGPSQQTFIYDGLYRLTSATGVSTVWEEADEYGDRDKHNYTLGMTYNSIHNITHKIRVQKISEKRGR